MFNKMVIVLSTKTLRLGCYARCITLAAASMLLSVQAKAEFVLNLKQVWFRTPPIYNDISTGRFQTNPIAPYQWSTSQSWPVLLSRSNQVTVVATFTAQGAPRDQWLRVVTSPNIGITFPDTEFNVQQNGDGDYYFYSGNSVVTSSVQILSALTLTFYSRPDTNTGWSQIATSSHPTYITLSNPLDTSKTYRTVLELACATGGATNEGQAFTNTWSRFTGRSVQTWYNSPLFYYQPGTSFTNLTSVEGLLTNRTGQCGAWQELLLDANYMNGIAPIPAKVVVSDIYYTLDQSFVVKNWTTNNAGGNTYSATYKWRLYPSIPLLCEMCPVPPGNNYGDLTSQSGLPGQGTVSGSPSEKAFGLHYIVKYGIIYYDPSYGTTYSNSDSMDASINAFGANGDTDGLGRLSLPTRMNPYPGGALRFLDNQY